jgi:PD-(D/E)XK nuclease superfamily
MLYRNADGKNVTHSSYSSRSTFKKCPREFQLTRIQGWWSRENRAAPLFGKCIEAGLQAFEENDRRPGSGVKVFQKLWEDVKLTPEFKTLVYTACEGDWEQLHKSGTEMMLLYEVKAPKLPIVKPIFQQKIRKTIFPGTNLAMLENVAILDILSFPPWNHPMLPITPDGLSDLVNGRPLIIDVKTSGKDFPTELVALDPQLAEYAWQTRIPDVAFLWFVKVGHGFKRGSRITTLRKCGALWAGWEGFVLDTGEPDAAGRMWVYVGSYDTLQKYEEAIKGLRGKARDAAEQNFLDGGRADGSIVSVSDLDLTKQRLQFAAARLPEKEMDDVGRSVAQATVEMVRAHEQDFYEKVPGVRFPNERCNFCAMRWICLNKPEERDKNLTRRGEEWLDAIDVETE